MYLDKGFICPKHLSAQTLFAHPFFHYLNQAKIHDLSGHPLCKGCLSTTFYLMFSEKNGRVCKIQLSNENDV